MNKEMIYIAYGSNMNIEQMKRRCPKATPIGKGILKDYKLVFKGVADVIKSTGDEVPIAIWKRICNNRSKWKRRNRNGLCNE